MTKEIEPCPFWDWHRRMLDDYYAKKNPFLFSRCPHCNAPINKNLAPLHFRCPECGKELEWRSKYRLINGMQE